MSCWNASTKTPRDTCMSRLGVGSVWARHSRRKNFGIRRWFSFGRKNSASCKPLLSRILRIKPLFSFKDFQHIPVAPDRSQYNAELWNYALLEGWESTWFGVGSIQEAYLPLPSAASSGKLAAFFCPCFGRMPSDKSGGKASKSKPEGVRWSCRSSLRPRSFRGP